MDAQKCQDLWSILSAGRDGGRRSVHGFGGRKETTQAAGDHLEGEAWQAEQRKDASTQGRECQQKPRLLAHQGEYSQQAI